MSKLPLDATFTTSQYTRLLAQMPVSEVPLTPDQVGEQAHLEDYHEDLAAPKPAAFAAAATVTPTKAQWAETQRCVVRAAYAGVKREPILHYTQLSTRWSGIQWARRSIQYRAWAPWYADCSSFATWCWWDASRWLKLPDIINAANWLAGYTGTMVRQGRQVSSTQVRPGDAAFFGTGIPYHTVVCVGGGLAVSHGKESAPEVVALAGQPISSYRTYMP